MALNNSSNLSNHKKNLRRMNRLQDKNNLGSFDNAAFQNDSIDDTSNSAGRQNDQAVEGNTSYKENQASAQRRLPNPKVFANMKGGRPCPMTTQNVLEPENIELQVKDGNLKQQDHRRALESVDESSNKNVSESKANDSSEENDVLPPIPCSEKSPKSNLMSNLQRFTFLPSQSTIQDRLRMSRPSLAVDMALVNRGSENDFAGGSNFIRSSSMREGGRRLKSKQRLLRDISFSDADDSTTKDYGSLKDINLPRRHGDETVCANTVSILEALMRDLIKRGKVHHVAVMDRENPGVLASVPSGMLTKTDALGMVKSTICSPSLFKIKIGDVDYNCFKHRHDAVQGRAPDLVMVMQLTDTCVVAGFSRDDAPGSCNSEVNEFAKVLEGAGW